MFTKWLCPEEFVSLEPIDVFHRESVPSDAEERHPKELRNLHMLVCGSFFADKNAYERFYIAVTADDYYKMKINGVFASQGPAPSYYFYYQWNLVDVTALLRDGDNEISLDVYYQGLINRVWNSGDLRMGFAACLYGERDGVRTAIADADESWKYAISRAYLPSPTVGYKTQYMEYVDTRLSIPDSCEYKNCVIRVTDYTFAPESTPCVDVYTRSPRSILKLAGGGCVCDFGHEITGSLCITADGAAGARVNIFCGEELTDDGRSVRHNMRANCDYSEYFLLGESKTRLEQYDYKAFRYAAVIPADGTDVHIEDITASVRHWRFDEHACTIVSNDKVLEAVFNLCKNGVRYGSQEVFVDCPSREKGQYAGDMTVTALSHMWLTGDVYLARKALCDQLRSSFICPGIMAVAPGSYMQEIADYSLQLPILVMRDYEHTRDAGFMRSCVPYLDGMLSYFAKYERPDGLLDGVSGKWNLVDWPDNLRDGYDFPLTNPIGGGVHNVINAFYVGALIMTEKIKDILGIAHNDKARLTAESFNRVFFDYERGIYRDSETSVHSALHSNILAPYFGFAPEGCGTRIADFIMSRGLCCGVYMSFFLLKSLCALGRYQDAYSLVTSTADNSWYNMIREGGSCCFEAWGKEKKWNTSLCHPWASAPVSVILEDFLGLRPSGSFKPHLPDGIHITAHVPLTLGGHADIYL